MMAPESLYSLRINRVATVGCAEMKHYHVFFFAHHIAALVLLDLAPDVITLVFKVRSHYGWCLTVLFRNLKCSGYGQVRRA